MCCSLTFFSPIIGTSALDFPFPTKEKYNMSIVPHDKRLKQSFSPSRFMSAGIGTIIPDNTNKLGVPQNAETLNAVEMCMGLKNSCEKNTITPETKA